MSNTLLDNYRYKRTMGAFVVFSSVLVALWIALYMPVFYLLDSDVAWKNSDLMTTWEFFVKPLFQYAFYFGSFSFIIYAILRFGKKGYVFTAVYAVATVLWYFLQPLSYMWVCGAIHWSAFWQDEAPWFLLSVFLDCLQMGILVLVLFLLARRNKIVIVAPRGRRVSQPAEWGIEDLRVLQKPFLIGAILAAVISPMIMIAQRLYLEGFYQMIGAGLSFSAEGALLLLGVALFFLSDILMMPIGYVVVRLVHWLLLRKSVPLSFWHWLFGRVVPKAEKTPAEKK